MKRLRALGYYGYSLIELVLGIKNWPALLPLFWGSASSEPSTITLRRFSLVFLVRSAMDVWSVKETFLDQFYTRYSLPVQDGWTVVDVGAGIGDFSIFAAQANPSGRVFAFEPFPNSYALLKQNLAENQVENVHAFQKAIWSRGGELELDLSSGEPLQFTSQDKLATGKPDGVLRIEAISLAQVFSAENLEVIDLLKLDCEGAEYEILFGAQPHTLARIERIILEYHDLDHNRHHSALAAYLEEQGFKVSTRGNLVHDHLGYLYATRGSH